MTTPPSKQLDQFVVRLPDGMRDRIKAAAAANNRSMNAEIVAVLQEHYPEQPPTTDLTHRETTLRAIDAALAEVRKTMIRQLEAGVSDISVMTGIRQGPDDDA